MNYKTGTGYSNWANSGHKSVDMEDGSLVCLGSMKISEMIDRLSKLKEQHGDVRVHVGEASGLANVDSIGFDKDYGVVIETN